MIHDAVLLNNWKYSFPSLLQKGNPGENISDWLWLILIIIVILITAWRLISNRSQENIIITHQPIEPAAMDLDTDYTTSGEHIAAPASSLMQSDDLAIVEGIGPKISGVLKANGINTFSELASTEVARIQQILTKEGLRLADPTTWPEQARLAAAGDWEALTDFQKKLKGGRRV